MSSASDPRVILHLVSRPDDTLARRVMDAQRTNPRLEVRAFDLSGPAPDYRRLVEEIFRADAVQAW
jgi:hypothetical protein